MRRHSVKTKAIKTIIDLTLRKRKVLCRLYLTQCPKNVPRRKLETSHSLAPWPIRACTCYRRRLPFQTGPPRHCRHSLWHIKSSDIFRYPTFPFHILSTFFVHWTNKCQIDCDLMLNLQFWFLIFAVSSPQLCLKLCILSKLYNVLFHVKRQYTTDQNLPLSTFMSTSISISIDITRPFQEHEKFSKTFRNFEKKLYILKPFSS